MEGKLIRSKRKTLSLRITPEGELEIRAPLGLPRGEIEAFVRQKSAWIEAHRRMVLEEQTQAEPLDEAAIQTLKHQAAQKLGPMLSRHAHRMGVDYGSVTIRCQRTRWGSCSASAGSTGKRSASPRLSARRTTSSFSIRRMEQVA